MTEQRDDVVEMPELNPEQTANMIMALGQKLDGMPSEPRELHNFLQDDLVPMMVRMHQELSAVLYYVGMHDDRITDLEEDAAGLDPEDAALVLDYLHESMDKLRAIHEADPARTKDLAALLQKGEAAVQIIEDAAGEEEEEEGPPPAAAPSRRRH